MEEITTRYDAVLSYAELIKMNEEQIHNLLCTLFPNGHLFDHSKDWRQDKKYILKAKGTKRDVIIGWLENFRIISLHNDS